MKTLRFTAILEKDADGFFAYCPELKGCHSQGASAEEALANLQEAAELYVETLSPDEVTSLAAKPRTLLATSLEVAHT